MGSRKFLLTDRGLKGLDSPDVDVQLFVHTSSDQHTFSH